MKLGARRWTAACLLVALAGCGWLTGGEPEPVRYTVVRGDTLFLIAKAHGVTVDELRDWNGIEGDLIEVDQILLIWPEGTADATAPQAGPGKKRPAKGPGPADEAGTADHGLTLPPEQPCLAGPTLDGAADGNGDGAVDVQELIAHVTRQVQAESDGEQTPTTPRVETGEPFPLATVGD